MIDITQEIDKARAVARIRQERVTIFGAKDDRLGRWVYVIECPTPCVVCSNLRDTRRGVR